MYWAGLAEPSLPDLGLGSPRGYLGGLWLASPQGSGRWYKARGHTVTLWFPLQGKPLRLAEGWAACAGGLGTVWSRSLRSGGRKRSPGGLGPGLSQPPGGGQEKRNWDVDGGGGCHGWQQKHLGREEDTDFQEGEREEGRRPKDTLLLILEVSQGGGGGGQDLFQGTVAGIVGLGVRMEVRPQTPGRWRGAALGRMQEGVRTQKCGKEDRCLEAPAVCGGTCCSLEVHARTEPAEE